MNIQDAIKEIEYLVPADGMGWPYFDINKDNKLKDILQRLLDSDRKTFDKDISDG